MAQPNTKPQDDGDDEELEKLNAFLDDLPGDDDEDDEDEEEGDDGGDDSGEGMPVELPLAASAPPTATSTAEAASPRPRGRPPKPREPDADRGLQRPRGRPPGVRGPGMLTPAQRATSPVLNRMRENQESAYQEIDTLLSDLNFDERGYQVRIERTAPDFDENDVPCSGYLATYKKKVTLDDIERRFGGGDYIIRINGPHPTTGRPGIIKTEKIVIAGPPKPIRRGRDDDEGKQRQQGFDLSTLVEANERSTQRLLSAVTAKSSEESGIEKILPVLTPLIEKFLSKSEETARLTWEAQREERRAEERRRDEERRREDERRAEEKEKERERREEEKEKERERREEERRREDARLAEERRAEERRRDEERERQREERDRLKEELRLAEERRREEREERQRQHEREMHAAAERRREEQQNNQRYLEMMQASSKTNTELLMQTMSFQLESLEKRNSGGGIETLAAQLLTLNNLKNTLTGGDQEPTGMEKFTEGLKEVVTTLVPIGQQAWAASKGGRPAPQQPQPNKPLVVDIGPAKKALPKPTQQPQAQPVAPQSTQNPGMPPAPPATGDEPPQTTTTTTEQADIVNDLTEFRMPTPEEASQMLLAGSLLVQNVDLAVQRELPAEDIVDKILVPFEDLCPMIMTWAANMDEQQLVEFVAGNVPASWAILTPRGEKLMLKAFALWKDSDDDDDDDDDDEEAA